MQMEGAAVRAYGCRVEPDSMMLADPVPVYME